MRFRDTQLWDKRERRGFLLWPRSIGHETRWLEFARWGETYMGWPIGWLPSHWIDEAA